MDHTYPEHSGHDREDTDNGQPEEIQVFPSIQICKAPTDQQTTEISVNENRRPRDGPTSHSTSYTPLLPTQRSENNCRARGGIIVELGERLAHCTASSETWRSAAILGMFNIVEAVVADWIQLSVDLCRMRRADVPQAYKSTTSSHTS